MYNSCGYLPTLIAPSQSSEISMSMVVVVGTLTLLRILPLIVSVFKKTVTGHALRTPRLERSSHIGKWQKERCRASISSCMG